MKRSKVDVWRTEAAGSLRLTAVAVLVLAAAYPALVGAFGRLAAPGAAAGSLVWTADGTVVGSALIAQPFRQPGYFWPRPSAAAWDASAAGGSNLPPGAAELSERIARTIAEIGGTPENPVPVDLLAASGSGLDPHISLAAALYQAPRVAAARRLDPGALRRWLAEWTGGRREGRGRFPLVNVLRLNLALNERFGPVPGAKGEEP